MRSGLSGCLFVIAMMGLTGCGGSTGASTPSHVRLPTASAAPSASPYATALAKLPGDTSITLDPEIYDPTGPCATVVTSVPVPSAPGSCGLEFLSSKVTEIPGESILSGTPMPATATVSAGVPSAEARQVASAYEAYVALQNWAYATGQPELLPMLEAGTIQDDRVYQEIYSDGGIVTSVPSCYWPTSLRVANANSTAEAYLQQLGWVEPSQLAVVATYPACPGITFSFLNKSTKQLFGQPVPASDVHTGGIEDIAPFGETWDTTGYATCGVPQLRSVCGG